METQASDKKKMTPLVFSKWVLLWLPLILFMPGLLAKQNYQLVLRDDTISPVIGLPRSLFYISLIGALGYAVMVFTFCREQIFTAFHNRVKDTKGTFGLLILTFIFTPLSIWVVGTGLNVVLDNSTPKRHQTKVQGPYRIRNAQYAKVQDWRDPKGYVLLSDGQWFLKEHPKGSTVTVVTKIGAFGYEYLAHTPQVPNGS